jgi:hypothetical protein
MAEKITGFCAFGVHCPTYSPRGVSQGKLRLHAATARFATMWTMRFSIQALFLLTAVVAVLLWLSLGIKGFPVLLRMLAIGAGAFVLPWFLAAAVAQWWQHRGRNDSKRDPD